MFLGDPIPAWFDILSMDPNVALNLDEDEAGIKVASSAIHEIIQNEIDGGIPSSRIVVGGFSQGAALAIYTTLTNEHNMGGIISLSGFLPLRNSLPDSSVLENRNIPALQVHGDADETAPLSTVGVLSNTLMKTFMTNLEFKVYNGLSHCVNPEETMYVKEFIDKILNNTTGDMETLLEKYENVSYNRSIVSSSDTRPLEQQIEKLGVSFMESKNLLYIINPAASQDFEEKVLKKLRHNETITTLRFHEIIGGKQKKVFDFGGSFCSLLRTHLPKVQVISVKWMAVKNFQLVDILSVTTVDLTDPQFKDKNFELRLANLKELSLQCTGPDPHKFATSLIQCPRIERFFSHKYWCDEAAYPTFYLPSCLNFCLRRADGLRKLHLYVPRITSLNLDANYDLSDFKLLQKGKASMKDFNLKEGEEESKFNLSITNAVLTRKVRNYLINHPRVLNVTGDHGDDSDEGPEGCELS